MPGNTWSAKRERQYRHIKESLEERGLGRRAAEIAARTVNKERAQHGEARDSSASSVHDVSAGHRGGRRSHQGPGGRTYRQLYNEAKAKGIEGRSKMSKKELLEAVS